MKSLVTNLSTKNLKAQNLIRERERERAKNLIQNLKGYLAKNLIQNLFQSAINFQKIHHMIWPKMVCFTLRGVLLFWVISARGKTSKKGNDFSKKKIVSLVGFGF